ncbi:NTF2 and RRM domain protein [Aspergillus melleus]|uniref:NTF2 and RRM domain protein n=1 Tax=Aspergillus melleus TaxID=138277 RepID=UPI001E8EEDF3|nr:uncharacterized protein LDX57_008060 [Aspergillus melleus]KAH8430397.1 hypothetical protein LDX57_008060 [Aspergillus melleus]
MADTTQAPINGGFPAQHAYHDSYSHAHVAATNAANFQPAQSSTPTNALPEQKNGISKDEVGWYFVEQYYTTMSRNPDKLPLFYARRSQLVFGTEAESVPVAVGQKAINEKIKQLDFQDCKVRVLNVDSQASFDNILIAVIGEISNKSEPSRKFVQTFVLAEQPNGYYVLNDVFRYLVDEEEIVNEETAPAAAPSASVEEPAAAAAAAAAEEPAQPEPESAPAVDVQETEAPAPEVEEKAEPVQENGDEAQPQEVDSQVNGADAEIVEPEQATAVAEEVEAEKPPTPEPTPAPSAQKEAPAPPKENAPPAKALPKTWANIASKSGAPAPVVPSIPAAPAKSAPATGSPQPAAAAPAAPATPAPENVPSQPPSNDGSGWQTAGHDHKKTQSRAGEEQPVLAYIKNVNEKVDANLLKQTLTRFGKLKHFDVSRSKNCAFAEFAEPAGYAAAVAANPHQIGSEQIYVEERRARGNAYGGNANYTAGRGGVGRGRGDRAGSQGRGGFQRDGRGGFAPRGRGNVKNRNQPQAA